MPSWAFGRANHKTAVIARGNAAGPAQLLNLSASLGGTGHTREAVRRPPGEDADSWVASQTLLVFQHVDLLWELLGDGCAPELPMTAGSSAEYLLPRDLALEASDDGGGELLRLPAAEYIPSVLKWASALLSDEAIFPTSPETRFPKKSAQLIKTITRRMFRIFAHIFHHHWTRAEELGILAHLNTTFRHVLFFAEEFELLAAKEFEPLKEVIEQIKADEQ